MRSPGEPRKLQKSPPEGEFSTWPWQEEWNGPDLITNLSGNQLAKLLDHELRFSKLISVDILCSCIKSAGLDRLIASFEALARRPQLVPVRVITTTQQQITEAAALQRLAGLGNVQVKVVICDKPAFHANSWLFRRSCDESGHPPDCICRCVVVVGSSNMTLSALTTGVEWSMRVAGTSTRSGMMADNIATIHEFCLAFDHYWNGRDRFWGNPHNVLQFDLSRPSDCALIIDRLRSRDPSKCGDPSCRECIAHADHVRLRRPRRPVIQSRNQSAPLPTHRLLEEPAISSAFQPDTYYPNNQNGPYSLIRQEPLTSPMTDGCFLAYYSAAHGHSINALLYGIDIDHQETQFGLEGSTLLHCASYSLHFEIVDALLSNGANPNLVDNFGNTALHRAFQSSPLLLQLTSVTSGNYGPQSWPSFLDYQARVVRSLLKYMGARGAEVENYYGLKPIEYCVALRQNHHELEDIFGPYPDADAADEKAAKVFDKHGIQIIQSKDQREATEDENARELFQQCRYPKWKELDAAIEEYNNVNHFPVDLSYLRPMGRLAVGGSLEPSENASFVGQWTTRS
ncbi:hypothetical protein jhhlp_007735 [Lomentospora prolificans]|uniref:Uncharacterized protein n=1 Tax=Lomentospora prolificans TaxID=41688 RepID=A0A2N3N0E8_9PEZI|nr:hypothetical protein jhhlp_007735 [Lomentospora prolificans]